MESVPDCDDRNEAIWNAWDDVRGPSEARVKARKTFGAELFEPVEKVCYFAEHETTGPDGSTRVYKLRDLAEINRTCNSRIARRGAFPAICDNHTPANPDAPAPDILAHGGGFRLGMIDNARPTWAIFADEYREKTHLSRLKRLPRRSVELITYPNGERFLDPIAALGSRAPRLALPVKYASTEHEGVMVERYSVAAPSSLPGGGNTFLPTNGEEPLKLGADQMNPGTLDEGAIAQITQAIMNTPQMQYVSQLMESGGATSPESGQQPAPSQVDDYMADGYMADGNMADDYMAGNKDGYMMANKDGYMAGDASGAKVQTPPANDMAFEGQMEKFGSEMPDDLDDLMIDTDQYAADNAEGVVTIERYQALEKTTNAQSSQIAKQNRQLKAMGEQLARTSRREEDGRRKARLTELAGEFPGLVDANEEMSRFLYSAGANVSASQFDTAVADIERYAARAATQRVVNAQVPQGVFPPSVDRGADGKIERNAAFYEAAIAYHMEQGNQGKQLNYEQCCEEVEKRFGQAV